MNRRALVVSAAVALAMAVGGWYWWGRAYGGGLSVAAPPDLTARSSVRIRVEVLNATRIRGLARQGTFVLRDRGFDVVAIGTSAQQSDSTLVLDRTGHPDWARQVARALGGARVEARPDSTLYVDVTVLLGRTWRPPPEPLHP
ncbi:MAG TPA: LytR C-terminal domain-containing protein [Gemmatimonadaceae bacterium]